MRILLLWDDKGPKITDLMKKLEGQSNKIVYWIGAPGGEKDKLPGTIFHASLDALFGIPAKEVDVSEFPPPGKDLIERLYKTESLILTMMNVKHERMSIDERRHLYYNMLQYWYGVFKKYKPDVMICGIIPHAVHTYLIYELARLFGVKIITSEDTWVPDRLLFFNDFWQGSSDLHKELQKNQGKDFSLEDLSDDLQEYYKMHTDIGRDATPVYMGIHKAKHSKFNAFLLKLKHLKNSIKKGTIFVVIPRYIFKQFKPNLKKEYYSVQKKPDFNKKFVYAPLQLQPERTTSPQGDMFVDLILMIETLSASLPSGWVIYVKEHPFQWSARELRFSSYRYQGYYKKIANLKNVQVIPIKTNSYTLINKSQAVAAVTGTAGWEAILRSKPAMVFGYSWYKDCSEIFKVRDVESCKEALKKIINGFTVDQQKVINYLKCFDDATVRGYFDAGAEKISKITKREKRDNIIQKIIFEMEKK